MKPWLSTFLVVIVALLSPSLNADSNKNKEAQELIEHARQLSEIRSPGAPPFYLKSKLRFLNDATPREGDYVETWAAPTEWTTETIDGGHIQVAVVNGRRYWFRGDESAPHRRTPWALSGVDGGFRINRYPGFWEHWNSFGKNTDRLSGSVPVRCVARKDRGREKSELCFAKDTGELVESVGRMKVRDRWVEATCTYTNYQQYLGKSVPKTIRCFDHKKPLYEEDLEELVPLAAVDSVLFQPLTDSEQSTYCSSFPTLPEVILSPDPLYRRNAGPQHVDLSIMVGIDGVPRNLRVQRPAADAEFCRAAVAAVQTWRFRPAQCDGEPYELQINVEVNF